MSKYILEGYLQTFDNKHNGRIYPKEAFDEAYRDAIRITRRRRVRKEKIKRLFDEDKTE